MQAYYDTIYDIPSQCQSRLMPDNAMHQENNTLLKFYLICCLISLNNSYLQKTSVQSVIISVLKYANVFKYVLSGLRMATIYKKTTIK